MKVELSTFSIATLLGLLEGHIKEIESGDWSSTLMPKAVYIAELQTQLIALQTAYGHALAKSNRL